MTKLGFAIIGLLIVIIGCGLFTVRRIAPGQQGSTTAACSASARPLVFVPNDGQVRPDVRLVARTRDCAVLLADSEARIVAADSATPAVIIQPIDARPHVVPAGEDPVHNGTSRLLDRGVLDPGAKVPGFRRVRYHNIYDGIDLIFHGSPGALLDYNVVVAPGARPEQIRLRMAAADSVDVDQWGDLRVRRGPVELRHRKPVGYQQTPEGRIEINGEYRLGPGRDVRFAVGKYDRSRPLVIDPLLLEVPSR